MKRLTSLLILLTLAGLAGGQTIYYSNNVSRVEAMRVSAAQLKVGMWEEEASQRLGTNGLKYCIGVGAAGGWDRCYGLSDGSSLHLSYNARSIARNGFWGGNGVLQKAFIQSNGVNIVSITLTNAP